MKKVSCIVNLKVSACGMQKYFRIPDRLLPWFSGFYFLPTQLRIFLSSLPLPGEVPLFLDSQELKLPNDASESWYLDVKYFFH